MLCQLVTDIEKCCGSVELTVASCRCVMLAVKRRETSLPSSHASFGSRPDLVGGKWFCRPRKSLSLDPPWYADARREDRGARLAGRSFFTGSMYKLWQFLRHNTELVRNSTNSHVDSQLIDLCTCTEKYQNFVFHKYV